MSTGELLAAAAWSVLLTACVAEPGSEPRAVAESPRPEAIVRVAPERLTVRVVAEHPHDPASFTQGLLFFDGSLYESTGQYGRSRVRRIEPATGRVLAERTLPPRLFGEGLARVGERLIQITWREGVALLWQVETLEPRGELRYRGEGWGLTFDGERLIMSDGGTALVSRDPESFEETGRVEVTLEGEPLGRLNELEWVDGAVWANVWGASWIVRIDPASGAVTAIADLSPLIHRLPPDQAEGIDVLNGIAWHAERGTFFVTGKLWPRLFEVALE